MRLWIVLTLIVSTCWGSTPYIVGIAGGSGSGKTTLVQKIQEALGKRAITISQDNYYKDLSHLSLYEKGLTNFDTLDALEFSLLRADLLRLKSGEAIVQPNYDFVTGKRSPGKAIAPAPIILVEGILLFANPEIADLFDLKIFVDVDDDIRLLRRVERDMEERGRTIESIKRQYSQVKFAHDTLVEPSKKQADLVIQTHGDNSKCIEMIADFLARKG